MSVEYGKSIVRDDAEFAAWADEATAQIVKWSCEYETELAKFLREDRPKSYPCAIVWFYMRHHIFVNRVYPSDFGALPPHGGQTEKELTRTVNSDSPDSEKREGGAK
jgi:hypothetical protein